MAYKHTNSKGVTYYLNAKEVTLRGGKTQTIYYFSKDERKDTGVDFLATAQLTKTHATVSYTKAQRKLN
jgi:hypothetical protein